MVEFADTVAFFGFIFEIAALLMKFFEEKPPDPIWNKLNMIHAKLNEIDDNVLATWVTERGKYRFPSFSLNRRDADSTWFLEKRGRTI
jgi:hypothetical protein